MANNLKYLDADQVIRSVYDIDNNRLRTDATLSASIGAIEVIIDHANDSIKIGDGTRLVDVTTNNELEVHDAEVLSELQDISSKVTGISSPVINNISIAVANTEQSFVIPATAKKVFFQMEGTSRLQYSFTSGQSGTNYITLHPGVGFEIENLELSSSLTLYYQATSAGDTLQILYWD